MPHRVSLTLRSLDATHAFARALGGLLAPGDVVLLSGDLGAGKTTLVRALASSLGIDERTVSSPTFTLMHAYEGGRIDPVVHMDAYRLEGEDESELLELGWDAPVRTGALTLIEWGERIERVLEGLLDEAPARIALAHRDETSRDASLTLPGGWQSRPGFDALASMGEGDTPPNRPGFPFSSEREQLADLYHWFGEAYRVSRPIEASDDPNE